MTRKSPADPVALSDLEIRAIQNVWNGVAQPDQQRRALEAILDAICDPDKVGFHTGPDGARLSDFAAGKRFVAASIRRIVNTPLGKLAEQSPA